MPDLNTDLTAFIEKAEAAIALIAAGLWQSDSGCVGCVAQDSCGREEGEPLACHEALAMLKRSIPALARVAMAAQPMRFGPCEKDDCRSCWLDEDQGIGKWERVCKPAAMREAAAVDAALAALSVALEENNG